MEDEGKLGQNAVAAEGGWVGQAQPVTASVAGVESVAGARDL